MGPAFRVQVVGQRLGGGPEDTGGQPLDQPHEDELDLRAGHASRLVGSATPTIPASIRRVRVKESEITPPTRVISIEVRAPRLTIQPTCPSGKPRFTSSRGRALALIVFAIRTIRLGNSRW